MHPPKPAGCDPTEPSARAKVPGSVSKLIDAWAPEVAGVAAAWLSKPRPARSPTAKPRTSALAVLRNDWKTVIGQTAVRFGQNQIPLIAAGVTFYLLLALFPALNALLSVFSLLNRSDPARSLGAMEFMLPAGGVQVINEAVQRLSQTGAPVRHITLIVSILISLWSANAGAKSLFTGLNITYGVAETRGFLRVNLVSLGFTLSATLGCALLMTILAASRVAPLLIALHWPLLLIATTFMLWLLYRFGASRLGDRLPYLLPGVILSTVLWLAGSEAFAWYASAFGHFNRTYGSLGAVVGFITWIWLSVMIALLGAEFNATLARTAPKPLIPTA